MIKHSPVSLMMLMALFLNYACSTKQEDNPIPHAEEPKAATGAIQQDTVLAGATDTSLSKFKSAEAFDENKWLLEERTPPEIRDVLSTSSMI
jgi:hypothetical protein